jgi:hypothetical protein
VLLPFLGSIDFDNLLNNTDDGSNQQLDPGLGLDSADDDDQSDCSDISVSNTSSSPGKEGSAYENQSQRFEDDQSTLSNKSSPSSRKRRFPFDGDLRINSYGLSISSPPRSPVSPSTTPPNRPRGFQRIGIPWLYSGAAVRFDTALRSRQPDPADGCRCLRVTEWFAIILAPIRRPGAERGGGLYKRVGLIDLTCASKEEVRQFENFEWVDSVVTII